ncbi:MAG: hypothetical protein MUC51_08200 [Anaerolineae bacterium]|nr:hypothetical protein [Anaerolineae bacterium]
MKNETRGSSAPMTTDFDTQSCAELCSAGPEVRADLFADNLLHLKPGERLWKLYCFWAAESRATQLRHRIYTKLKTDGRLALVTFAIHTPIEGRPVRSNIVRVPDLPAQALDRIISAIIAQTKTPSEEIDELDLSAIPTLEAQFQRLANGD